MILQVKKEDWLVRNITSTKGFEKIVIVQYVNYDENIMKLSNGIKAHPYFVDYRHANILERLMNALKLYRQLRHLRRNIKWLF